MSYLTVASRYLNAGCPKVCYNCQEPFDGKAYRGRSGMYYCSPSCRTWNDDDPTAEDAARMQ